MRARLLPSSITNILLGGDRVVESSGVERRGGVLGLQSWKPGKDKDPDQVLLPAEVRSFLSDYRSGRELTKWQKKFFMLEAGFALQVIFLQRTMKFRNKCMWAKPDPDETESDGESEMDDAEVEDEPDADNNNGTGVGSHSSLSQSQQSAVGPSFS